MISNSGEWDMGFVFQEGVCELHLYSNGIPLGSAQKGGFRTDLQHRELPVTLPLLTAMPQSFQERFLALAKAVAGTPDALRSERYEEDTGQLLTEMLAGFGFTPDQASRLTRLIHWPLLSQEEYALSNGSGELPGA